MKKLLLFVIAAAFLNCGEKDVKAEAIKSIIIQNGFGEEMNYEPISTSLISNVSHQDIVDVYLSEMRAEKVSIDTLILNTKAARDIQKQEYNTELYHIFDYYLSRLNDYKLANDPKSISFSVYKHSYNFINPMFNDAKVNVTNFYFFTPDDILIGYMSDTDFKDYNAAYIQHKMQPLVKMHNYILNN